MKRTVHSGTKSDSWGKTAYSKGAGSSTLAAPQKGKPSQPYKYSNPGTGVMTGNGKKSIFT